MRHNFNNTSVCFVNDKVDYNVRYRSDLMRALAVKYKVKSCGLYDDVLSFLFTLFSIVSPNNQVVVSSNLKSNLVVFLFFWKSKIIIINGLGRFRRSPKLRTVLVFLIKCQRRENIILVQNYADYRFFRKQNYSLTKIYWMPGSGGIKRSVGLDQYSASVITRDSKLPNQIKSIREFYSSGLGPARLKLIGVTRGRNIDFNNIPHEFVGYVDQEKILSFSKNIIVPDGYGEGIPHNLVDAIVSNASIFLTKRNYIQYGFYNYTGYEEISGNDYWVKLLINKEIRNLVSSDNIVAIFCKQIDIILQK